MLHVIGSQGGIGFNDHCPHLRPTADGPGPLSGILGALWQQIYSKDDDNGHDWAAENGGHRQYLMDIIHGASVGGYLWRLMLTSSQ